MHEKFMETQAPEIKMEVKTSGERQQEDRASLMENTTSCVKTCGKVEKADRASELRELEEYFYALEADRRNFQYLLQEQKEDHEMALRAQEREAIQERLEWERQMRKREEALQAAFLSVVMSRQKMLKDLKARMSATSLMDQTSGTEHIITSHIVPQGSINLRGTAVCLDRQRRKWWCLSCCSSHVDSQDANTSSATADKMADLQLIAELEERVRKAEAKKQRKALKKAKKQAKKAEKKAMKAEKKRAKKEGKKAGNTDDENSTKQSLSSAKQ